MRTYSHGAICFAPGRVHYRTDLGLEEGGSKGFESHGVSDKSEWSGVEL